MYQTTEKLELITNEGLVNRNRNIDITSPPMGDRQSETVSQTLDKLFPEQEREVKNIKKAKEILGNLSNKFNDQQLADLMTEVQFLADSWLDDFEKSLFNGLTLQELLHEKGSL